MPGHFGNISQAASHNGYLGNVIRGLPILKPFKIHYHDPRHADDDLSVGVFIILPQEHIDDEKEVLDLTISLESNRILNTVELPSVTESKAQTSTTNSEYHQDIVDVKLEPTSDQDDYDDSDTTEYHNYTIENLVDANSKQCEDTEMSQSTNLTEALALFKPKVEIENFEREGNGKILLKRVSTDDIDMFLQMNATDGVDNKNTQKKTKSDLKLFNLYLEKIGEERTMEMMPPDQLNDHICGFLLSVTKKDGDEYEPTSIRSFVSSIDRHLRTKGYTYSIISSSEFAQTRRALKAKQNHVKSLGKGKTPEASEPLDDATIEKFYESGTLGDSNPSSLIHSMWLICSVNFGIKPGQDMYDMKWGDVQLKEDATGKYLEYDSDRMIKRRTGVVPRGNRNFRLSETRPRAYATSDPQRDPVHLYTLYKNKRPEGTLYPECPFFLSTSHQDPRAPERWYNHQQMGIKKIYGIINKMKNAANLATDKRIRPLSACKRAIQKLYPNKDPSHHIGAHTSGIPKNGLDIVQNSSDLGQSKETILLPTPSSSFPSVSGAFNATYPSQQYFFVVPNNTFYSSSRCSH